MSVQDRRSGEERRQTKRYPLEINVEWQGSAGRLPGSICDVSLDGCFVLCSGDVIDGENVKVFVPLTDGMRAEFTGRVANSVVEIGFGMKFDQLSAAQRDLLVKIVRESEQA